MHDINPLGTTMHLRELDRRAAAKLRSLPLKRRADSKAPLIWVALGEVLTRLREGYAGLRMRAG